MARLVLGISLTWIRYLGMEKLSDDPFLNFGCHGCGSFEFHMLIDPGFFIITSGSYKKGFHIRIAKASKQ